MAHKKCGGAARMGAGKYGSMKKPVRRRVPIKPVRRSRVVTAKDLARVRRRKGGGMFGKLVKLGKKELVSALKNPKNQKAALNAMINHAPIKNKKLLRHAAKLL